jgi:hypothetical protein
MSIIDTLKSICELQPQYSSSNTEAMQLRGKLIRNNLAQEIRSRLPELQKVLDPLFDDISVQASDGLGNKIETPWVRVYSKTMSPNPREGFYLVIHFAANGSAFFITLGCGSTIWKSGSLTPVSDEELFERTRWSKQVITNKWKTVDPFNDAIELGARSPLSKTFEKATVIAKKIPVGDIDLGNLEKLLFEAVERLGEIYLAQLDKRDISFGDQVAEEIISISKPLKKRHRSQGFLLNGAQRKAIELRAMNLAIEFLQQAGFRCIDSSATESYDILAELEGEQLKIEVKGTTSDFCESVVMTRNEVDLHREEKGKTGLIVVSSILLNKESSTASGGNVDAMLRWDIDEWDADPIAYQVKKIKNK